MGQSESREVATEKIFPPSHAKNVQDQELPVDGVEEHEIVSAEKHKMDCHNGESWMVLGDKSASPRLVVNDSPDCPEMNFQQKDTLNSTFISDASFHEDHPKTDAVPKEETGLKKKLVYIGLALIVLVVTIAILVGTLGANKTNTAASLTSQAFAPSSSPSMEQSLEGATATPPPDDPSMLGSSTVHPVDESTEIPLSGSSTVPPVDDSTDLPSSTISPTKVPLSYVPGKLTVLSEGLLLSEGLSTRIIAQTGERVRYHNGTSSSLRFHGQPDFGATFVDTRPFNLGGWVYTSNSEMARKGRGGVGAITFDASGNAIDYRMVLEGTTMNCGGGRTPWNTWVTCEEIEFFGEIYQVDPFGVIKAEKATIGSQLGRWESFAYDVRDSTDPKYFATEDHNKGTVRRFRPEPSLVDWDNPWNMLHVNGTIDYLIVYPNDERTGGGFDWTNDIEAGRNNARSFYPQSEGIDVYNGVMYVVCKNIKQLFIFDLDNMTYTNHSTVSGLFDGGPDQMQRILGNNPGDLLYFTEEGGSRNGVHARDNQGRFYTVFESPIYRDETTGLAFSPDGMHMYVAYQDNGILYDIWRDDGRPFGARTLNVKYHNTDPLD